MANRYAPAAKWLSAALFIVALMLLIRTLPLDRGVEALKTWVRGIGVWGPIVFGLIYVAATVALLPGSLITLAGGAVFGLFWGGIAVSLASTTGAALAFLIARYFARDKIEQRARRNPKFQAIDRAIGERGWKIVALLRLSPAIPFNLSNYLFGLTSVRFWPYVLSSWIAMMPGTIMYVYVGYAAGKGLEAAAGANTGKTPGEWALLFVGLAATVAVTIYVTQIAKKAIREQTTIDDGSSDSSQSASAAQAAGDRDAQPQNERAQRWPWGATIILLLALIATGAAAYAYSHAERMTEPQASAPGSNSLFYAQPNTAGFRGHRLDCMPHAHRYPYV